MSEAQELVTVFRSADADAELQAEMARDVLARAGFAATICDDSARGVPPGAFEVRVPAEQQTEAEKVIDSFHGEPLEPPDLSHDLDMVVVFSSDAAEAEMLATEVRSVLTAAEIPTTLISGSMFPSLPYEVRVPRNRLEDAKRAIAEAAEAGPEAADEAERQLEETGGSEGGV